MKPFMISVLYAMLLMVSLLSVAQGHSLEELRERFDKEKNEMPSTLEKVTKSYELQPTGAIRERLHAIQHEMLLDHQAFVTKQKCVELLTKLRRLDRKIEELRRGGELAKVHELEQQADQAHAFAEVNCTSQR